MAKIVDLLVKLRHDKLSDAQLRLIIREAEYSLARREALRNDLASR